MRKDTDRQRASLGAQDILIEPNLGSATATDFTAAAAMSSPAARPRRGTPWQGSPPRASATPRIKSIWRGASSREPGLPPIQFVRVDEQSKRYEKTIMAEMQPLVGKPLDLDQVGERITELYGLGNFETLDYSLVEQPRTAEHAATAGSSAAAGAAATTGTAAAGSAQADGSGIEVRARRKSWGPNYLRFGLNLEDDFQGNSHYNAAARFVLTELNELGAELLTDVQIGSDPKVFSEFYQPLDARRAPGSWRRARASRRAICRSTATMSQIADFRDREAEADIDFGRNLGNWGEIRVGLPPHQRLRPHARWGDPDLVDPQYNNGEYFFKFSYDRLDNVHFPREGQTFTLQWDANRTNLGADYRLRQGAGRLADGALARAQHAAAVGLGGHHPGRHLQSDRRCRDFYSLGGFLNLSGLRARVVDRSELCDRPCHLLSQDRPRRRGFFRVSRLSRHVAGGRQYLGSTAAT